MKKILLITFLLNLLGSMAMANQDANAEVETVAGECKTDGNSVVADGDDVDNSDIDPATGKVRTK